MAKNSPAPLPPPKPSANPARKDPPTDASRTQAATEVAKKTAGGITSLLMWIVPLVVIVFGVLYLVKGGKPPVQMQNPEGVLEAYTAFVQPYAPPSNIAPSKLTSEQWMNFFDKPTQMWFNDNIDRLSWMFSQNADEWKAKDRDLRRMDAMRYAITQGPLRGIVTIKSRSEDQAAGTAELRATGGGGIEYAIKFKKIDDSWVIEDLMGQTSVIEARLKTVRTP